MRYPQIISFFLEKQKSSNVRLIEKYAAYFIGILQQNNNYGEQRKNKKKQS